MSFPFPRSNRQRTGAGFQVPRKNVRRVLSNSVSIEGGVSICPGPRSVRTHHSCLGGL